MIFGLKAGLAIGGAMVAGILAIYGYKEGLAVQNDATINGIKTAMSIYPFITFCVAVAICLFYYEINKKMETQIQKELEARR